MFVDPSSHIQEDRFKVFMVVSPVLEAAVEESGVALKVVNLGVLFPVTDDLAYHKSSEHTGWMCRCYI